MPEYEQHLVQNPWAGLPVLDGTRWWKPGEYSGFHFKHKSSILSFLLPITSGGGFVIHETGQLRIAFQANSRSNAVFTIQSEKREDLLFWNMEAEGVVRQLHYPLGTIIFRN